MPKILGNMCWLCDGTRNLREVSMQIELKHFPLGTTHGVITLRECEQCAAIPDDKLRVFMEERIKTALDFQGRYD